MLVQCHNIHFVLTAIAIAALVPAVYCVQFPLKWDLAAQFSAFTMLGFESVMVAATLYAISIRLLPCRSYCFTGGRVTAPITHALGTLQNCATI